jgi:hypothetical protein
MPDLLIAAQHVAERLREPPKTGNQVHDRI